MFTLYYNQGGDSHMHFTKTVAEIIGVKPKYTGVPKCAYIIDYATVTRQGNIEVDERTDRTKLVNLMQKLMERGYMTEQSGTDYTTALAGDGLAGEAEEPPVDVETPVNVDAPEEADPLHAAEPPQAPELPQATEVGEQAAEPQAPEAPHATEDGNVTTTISVPRDIFTDLGAVQKLFIQNAKDEFVSARRRREACRGTLTDDNAAMADSDKHNV